MTYVKAESKGSFKTSAASVSKLKGNAKKVVGKRPVFNISLKHKEGKKISKLAEGKVTIHIPYKAAKNENVRKLYAVYINGKGKFKICSSLY